MESRDVRDGDVAEHAREQVGPLVGDRRDERAAKARSVDGQFRGAGVPCFYQILGAAHKVVVGVLLVGHDPVCVPALSVLAAAAHAAGGIHGAKGLRGDEHVGLELDAVDDVEPPVPVEDSGVGSVELDALLGRDEERDICSSVGGGDEDLRGRVRRQVDAVDRRRLPDRRQVSGLHPVEAVDGPRVCERRELEKDLGRVPVRRGGDGARAGEGDVCDLGPVGGPDKAERPFHVVEVGEEESGFAFGADRRGS